jgi:chromosome segregation ATPase
MATRTRAKKAPTDATPEQTPEPSHSCTAELFTELRTLRDEVAMLAQKAAAAEERAFHMAATMKEQQDELQQLRDKMYDTRARLTDVERTSHEHEDAMRSKSHNSIEEIRTCVQEMRQQNATRSANVAGRIAAMRAESMISDMDDARSEVSTALTASTGYAHSSTEAARAAMRRYERRDEGTAR